MLVSTGSSSLPILLLVVVEWTSIVMAYTLGISVPDASPGNFKIVDSHAIVLLGTFQGCELRNSTTQWEESPLRTSAGIDALNRLKKMWTKLSVNGRSSTILDNDVDPLWKGITPQYETFQKIIPRLLRRTLQDNVFLPMNVTTTLVERLSVALLGQGSRLAACLSAAEEAADIAMAKTTAVRSHGAESCFQKLIPELRASVVSGIDADGILEHPEVTLPFFQLWATDYVMLSLAELGPKMLPYVTNCSKAELENTCREQLRSLLNGVQNLTASLRHQIDAVEGALETMKKFNDTMWKQAITTFPRPVEPRVGSCEDVVSTILGNATVCISGEAVRPGTERKQLSCGYDVSKEQHCKVATVVHPSFFKNATDLCLRALGGLAYFHEEAARKRVANAYQSDILPFIQGLNETWNRMVGLEIRLKEKLDNS